MSEYGHVTLGGLSRTLATVLQDIAAERVAQDLKWGGTTNDDEHDGVEWCWLLQKRLAAATKAGEGGSLDAYRRRLIQTAALAVAAVEAHDRLWLVEKELAEKRVRQAAQNARISRGEHL